MDFVSVLGEEAERVLSDTGGLIAERNCKRVCCSGNECSDTRKVERARRLPEVVVEKLPVLSTDFSMSVDHLAS